MSVKTKEFLATILFGLTGCILTGILFFGKSVINFNDTRSIIVIYGFLGAVFFSSLMYGQLKDHIITALFLYIINVVLQGKQISVTFLIRDAVLLSSIFAALLFYKYFSGKFNFFPLFVRSLSLTIFTCVCYVLAILLLILIFGINLSDATPTLIRSAKLAGTIGLGLGIGFDFYVKFRTKIVKID